MKAVFSTILVFLYLNSAYGSFFVANSCHMNSSINTQMTNENCTCSFVKSLYEQQEPKACCTTASDTDNQPQEQQQDDQSCCRLVVKIHQTDDALLLEAPRFDSAITTDVQQFSATLDTYPELAVSIPLVHPSHYLPPINLPLLI